MESPGFLTRKAEISNWTPHRPISDLGSRFSDAGLVHFLNSPSCGIVDASSMLLPTVRGGGKEESQARDSSWRAKTRGQISCGCNGFSMERAKTKRGS